MRIIDDARAVIVDEEIPGGLLVPGGLHGWKAFGEPPTKWIYTDRQKPAVHNGIRKLVVKDLSRVSPNRIDVFLLAKSGTYAVSGSGIPLEMSFELNAQAFPPGGTPGRDQCAETKFQLPPNKPACITKPGTVDCK